jgi:hypothetical protein
MALADQSQQIEEVSLQPAKCRARRVCAARLAAQSVQRNASASRSASQRPRAGRIRPAARSTRGRPEPLPAAQLQQASAETTLHARGNRPASLDATPSLKHARDSYRRTSELLPYANISQTRVESNTELRDSLRCSDGWLRSAPDGGLHIRGPARGPIRCNPADAHRLRSSIHQSR